MKPNILIRYRSNVGFHLTCEFSTGIAPPPHLLCVSSFIGSVQPNLRALHHCVKINAFAPSFSVNELCGISFNVSHQIRIVHASVWVRHCAPPRFIGRIGARMPLPHPSNYRHIAPLERKRFTCQPAGALRWDWLRLLYACHTSGAFGGISG